MTFLTSGIIYQNYTSGMERNAVVKEKKKRENCGNREIKSSVETLSVDICERYVDRSELIFERKEIPRFVAAIALTRGGELGKVEPAPSGLIRSDEGRARLVKP